MKILFVIDKLELKYFEFNDLVTDFWFIKEFLKSDNSIDITINQNLYIENSTGCALVNSTYLSNENIYKNEKLIKAKINDYDVVFFRSDPPVDPSFINACTIFDFIDKDKTLLINNPFSVKNFNEKLQVNIFPNYVPKNIVTASNELIHNFVIEHCEAVIKPLNECFGSGVYYLSRNDKNLLTIIKNATKSGTEHVIVQEFLPSKNGEDKRVLIIGKEVLDECILKLPQENGFKFSEHSDKYFAPTYLTSNEKMIAQEVADYLYAKGIYLVGLDMMNEKIIEINVTSPCFFIREINRNYGINFEEKIMSKLNILIQNLKSAKVDYATSRK